MPRPNQPRTIASERALARRVADERETRSWSLEGLASRMTLAGCSIQASAIYKIEKADPPRRITVDELVAFAAVFELPVEELLLPPEVASKRRLVDLLTDWEVARRRAATEVAAEAEALETLRSYIAEHSDMEEALESALGGWVDHYFEPDEREEGLAHTMWKLTKSPEWRARLLAELEGAR